MSYPVSLQQIKIRALQRANLEGSGAFLPERELTDMVNTVIAEWYDIIRLTTFGGQYYRSDYSFNTVNGGQSYPLPIDFLSLISGDVYISTTWKVCMKAFQEEDRNSLTGPALIVGWFGPQVWYQLQGQFIKFLTSPTAAYQVTLNYVPVAPVLANAGDTIDSINSFDEFIVIKTAIKACIKAGMFDTVNALRVDLEDQRQRLLGAVGERDTGIAETVHDLQGNTTMGYGFAGYGEGWP